MSKNILEQMDKNGNTSVRGIWSAVSDFNGETMAAAILLGAVLALALAVELSERMMERSFTNATGGALFSGAANPVMPPARLKAASVTGRAAN